MPTLTQDPRSIVTPEVFSVHPPLLGTPLAEPWRRAVAILIDLLVVALVTALTSGFWFILGVVVAAFFFSRATRPGSEGRRSPAFRFFLGCMGVTALTLTIVVFRTIRFVNRSGDLLGPDGPNITAGIDGREVEALGDLGLRGAIGGLTESLRLASADSPAEAVLLATLLGRRLMEAGTPLDEIEDVLAELIPEDAGGVDGDVLLDRAMAALNETPGKRALRIRVVRLDGNPVSWWHAFERAGGYAAGLATGTLGFAQIYWDPNRQGIHDKVAGTVVILDGAEKIPGPWTLTESTVAASASAGSVGAGEAATKKEG